MKYEELKDASKEELNKAFTDACWDADFDKAKYLLTSPELKEHADVKTADSYCLNCACREGNMDAVKYFLTSPELKEHADIHAKNDVAFKWLCYHGHIEIIKFFIFEMNLKRNADIEQYFKENPNSITEQIKEWFDKQELKEKLMNDLDLKVNTKKSKIKL